MPQVLNPPSGFIQSCNNSPYRTTDGEGNPKPEDFPAAMGIETSMTNRSLRAFETYGADKSITREKFYQYKYDKAYSTESVMAKYLDKLGNAETSDDELDQEAFDLIKKWDRRTDKPNTLAALGVLAGEPYRHWHKGSQGKEPDPVELLSKAATYLKEKQGTLQPPWEKVLRLRRGGVDLGLGGGPDCLRCIEYRKNEDGTLTGQAGDCFFMMAQWDKDGKQSSEEIHQYGAASTDPDSPHYADQAPLFADEKMRPSLLTEADIRAHLEREYRPGEVPEPWYKK